ncbi:synaptic vesicle glycoprotein 2B-like isoform X2 [Phlebotomus papatasi]|uniref:synaptic vesicle glycoprotein 2B-like isoform X2 n=1 Tax=Phlebotomus papatasi TaxID=29031 RepID=UPI002483CD62|nr:synaptic vesicle glycoprotein 2B-like isoform X2 [Phlebotomus papatasi]
MVSNDRVIFTIDVKLGGERVKNGQKICENGDKISLDEALDQLGFGRIQLLVVLAAGLCLLTVINETMGIGMLMPVAQCDLQLTSSDKGLLSAISFLGIMASSHFWGYLADTRGRRQMIMITLFSTAIVTILSSVAQNFTLFVVLRFLSGVSISGPSATIYPYLGEFNSIRNRDAVITFTSTFAGLSSVIVPALGWYLLPQTWALEVYEGFFFRPWRLQLILHTLPGLLAALLVSLLPESPKFLVSQGKTEEALDIIRWIHRKNSGDSEMEIRELTSEAPAKGQGDGCMRSLWHQMVPLVSFPYLIPFLLYCCLQFGVFYVCAGLGLWFPDIVNRVMQNIGDESRTLCQTIDFQPNATHIELLDESCDDSIKTDTFLYNIFYGLIYVSGYIILGFLIKFFGRRILLVSLLGGSAAVGLALTWLTSHTLMIILLSMHLMFAGVSISVINSSVVAVFPTHLRATAMCITLMFGRLGTFAGSNIIGYFFDINCQLTFFLTVGLMMSCATASFFVKTK